MKLSLNNWRADFDLINNDILDDMCHPYAKKKS